MPVGALNGIPASLARSLESLRSSELNEERTSWQKKSEAGISMPPILSQRECELAVALAAPQCNTNRWVDFRVDDVVAVDGFIDVLGEQS